MVGCNHTYQHKYVNPLSEGQSITLATLMHVFTNHFIDLNNFFVRIIPSLEAHFHLGVVE